MYQTKYVRTLTTSKQHLNENRPFFSAFILMLQYQFFSTNIFPYKISPILSIHIVNFSCNVSESHQRFPSLKKEETLFKRAKQKNLCPKHSHKLWFTTFETKTMLFLSFFLQNTKRFVGISGNLSEIKSIDSKTDVDGVDSHRAYFNKDIKMRQ